MRLIDADEAVERANASDKIVGPSIWETSEVVEFLEDCPTVDAVEVVRRKDCKSWIPYGPGSLGTCRNCNFSDKPITHANHFCAYGERKGND